MSFTRATAATTILLTFPLLASAAELHINPGLWKTEITRTNPMNGTSTTKTNTECVKKGTSFDPRSMLASADSCHLTRDQLSGDTLNFQMECTMQGSQAKVNGVFQAGKDSGKGKMEMEMKMGPMSMNMQMNWTATRLGDCP